MTGDTTVVATATSGRASINSKPSPIQVFPPLEIDPKNVTLIIGARFQFRTFGGPQPEANVEFSLVNDRIARANSVGLVDAANLGSTKVVAKSVALNRATGKQEVSRAP